MSMAEGVSFNFATVEGLSNKFGEPTWVKELRLAAFQAFETLPLPAKDEAWRNLRLRGFSFADLIPHTETTGVPEPVKHRIDAAAAGTLVQRNSLVVDTHLSPELKEKGVILTSLEHALVQYPELVRPYLSKLYPVNESKFAALHYALMSGGAFLYIPANLEVKEIFQLFTFIDARNAGTFNHTLIVADKFSKVTIIDYESSSGDTGQSIRSGSVEVVALDGAQVTYVSLQNFEQDVQNFNVRRAQVGREADVKWIVSELGAKLSRSESTSYIDGDAGNSDAVVVFFASGEQVHDVTAAMVHASKHGSSDIAAKGVMTDSARTIWRGMGHIKHGAVGSKTFQRENSLILSRDAHGDAIPGLLIQETNVAGAGHAATVGKIDELHLFYLMSRGISEATAMQMIVEGFFSGVLERIPFEAIRTEVQHIINRKLGL
ncbi:MAG: Fe-S cluster assembly protein SufD [Bacilli bacterium]|nr:Fe-S cluster assembly protein SufD [Bacilli bacterium]